MQTIKFPAKDDKKFYQTMRSRVDGYFKDNNISKFGGIRMIMKTVAMLSIYFVPFGLILGGVITNMWVIFGMMIMMGFGLAGIGLAIMHDANHGAYSSNRKVNKFVGYVLNMVGGNSINWRIQHNVLHHSFTNIEGHDEDIDPAGVLRFSPHAKWRAIHKYQHFYAWFFYGLMTLSWIVNKDFKSLVSYNKRGLLKGFQTTFGKEMVVLIFSKIAYYGYVVVLPYFVLRDTLGINIGYVLLGVVIMHFVAGLILALVFQPAHVMDECAFPLPDDDGNIEDIWAAHQLRTTCNFANKNVPVSWFVGGLNFQVEHHLFPDVSHIHYPKIAQIVKETAEEFGIPYYAKKTFTGAVIDHARFLKALGKKDHQPKLA
ncbi:MAG: acyl-CoA desaturase [Flavobacteriales bacterium]|nr:acyl-CoA desaturase [Flavobacteriales bacterium]